MTTDYRDDDRRDCGYCPHCARPLTGVTRAALGHCEIHGWVWAEWTPKVTVRHD